MTETLTPLPDSEAGTIDKIFQLNCVYGPALRKKHLASAMARNLPRCGRHKERPGKVAIVASGPSATDCVDILKDFDGEIWGINGAFAWMLKRGIRPTGFVGLDPEEILKDYLIETPDDATYYLAAQVHPEVFDHLAGKKVRVWFPADDEVKYPFGAQPVFGGSTCLGRAPNLAYLLGYREVHIFGGDSSFTSKSHVYGEQGEIPGSSLIFELNGRKFITTRQMAQQACEFAEQMVEWARPGVDGSTPLSVSIYGDGLMQYLYQQNFQMGVYGQYMYEAVKSQPNRKERRALRKKKVA